MQSRQSRTSGARATRRLAGALMASIALFCASSERTRATGDIRTISIFNIHTNETTTITFKRDGQWVPGALDTFNFAMRDWRKSETIKMDPELLDLLWQIHEELGSKAPIQLICGYRSRGTNEMLRKTVGGQASESRHILGKAADVQFPDVPLKALRYSALVRERGGVGYYPTSAIPFVHIDTDRVRHWPNLPRYELALLFPSGHTQHHPADGGAITPDDVRIARATHQDLAVQVANFFDSRAGRRPPVALAGLDQAIPATVPSAKSTASGLQVASYQPPQLIEAPRIVDRPSRLTTPSASEQARLADLFQRAAFMPDPQPRLLAPPALAKRPQSTTTTNASAQGTLQPARDVALASTFVAAPDFDEDHPEELDYRPFPIIPLLTETASADDPALVTLVHPDVARTLELLDQTGSVPPMRLRPSLKVASQLWDQHFSGQAVNFNALDEAGAVRSQAATTDRRVRTQ